jgi:hypothetical protein
VLPVAVLLAAVAWLAGAGAARADLTPPSADPFYTPPPGLRADAPGTVLRWRQVTVHGTEAALTSMKVALSGRGTASRG